MSRLVNYGAGEIADRLTILALKVAHGYEANQETNHWETERNALLVQARPKNVSLEDVIELAAINAMIWQAEDELRHLRAMDPTPEDQPVTFIQAGRLAFQLQRLNDRRAKCIEHLNREAGDFRGVEKVASGSG